MSMTPNPYAMLFLGWMLGFLSPLLTDCIRDVLSKGKIRKAIENELSELRYRMAALAFGLVLTHGKFDRAFLTWFKTTIQDYSGVHQEGADILSKAVELLEQSDESIAKFVNSQQTPTSYKATALKQYSLPYLETHLSDLDRFSEESQGQLLEIRVQLGFLNDRVDDHSFFYQKTFDSSIDEINATLIQENLKSIYSLVAENAQHVADQIAKLGLK